MLNHLIIALCGLAFAAAGFAKLPDATPEQKAVAAQNAAKAAHTAKADAYKQCMVQTQLAEMYVKEQRAKGKSYTPEATPACVNPGPFTAPAMTAVGTTPPQAAAAPAQPAAPAAKK